VEKLRDDPDEKHQKDIAKLQSELDESKHQGVDLKNSNQALHDQILSLERLNNQLQGSLLQSLSLTALHQQQQLNLTANQKIFQEISLRLEAEAAKMECTVCMEKLIDIVFAPCGHSCTCSKCSIPMKECPICRTNITSSTKIYLV
jgi:hypothetical protein